MISVQRAGDAVMSVTWELEGQRFMGLNAGPHFTFNEAVSFFVACETQQEVDELWDKLLAARRQADAVRLAEGSVRPVVADHPERPAAGCSAIPTARRPAARCRR